MLIKYFFRQSKNPKNPSGRYKNEGVIFYNDKEYYINKISNIDYFQTKPEKEFDTFDIRNWLKDDLILIEKVFEISIIISLIK